MHATATVVVQQVCGGYRGYGYRHEEATVRTGAQLSFPIQYGSGLFYAVTVDART